MECMLMEWVKAVGNSGGRYGIGVCRAVGERIVGKLVRHIICEKQKNNRSV